MGSPWALPAIRFVVGVMIYGLYMAWAFPAYFLLTYHCEYT